MLFINKNFQKNYLVLEYERRLMKRVKVMKS